MTKNSELPLAASIDTRVPKFSVLVGVSLTALAVVASFAWFWSLPLQFDTFAGDDLTLMSGQSAGSMSSTLSQALVDTTAEKYRPVATVLFYLTYKVFGAEYRYYLIANTILYGLLCGSIAFALWLYANVRLSYVFLLAVLLATSRFAAYYVLQRHGIMEIVALAFASLTIGFCLLCFNRKKRLYWWCAIAAFVLAIHTHERYVVLAVVLSLAAFLGEKKIRVWTLGLLCLPFLLVAANILTKHFILHTAFLTGTGGAHISFDSKVILEFLVSGFCSVMGFDVGPAYLSAIDFRSLGARGHLPVALIVFGLATLLVVCWRRAWLGMGLIASVGLLSTLLSASITFRQEYRWLLCSEFIVLSCLSMVTTGAHLAYRNKIVNTGFVLIVAGFVCANVWARQFVTNIFFIGWLVEAESARRVVVEGASRMAGEKTFYLVDGEIGMQLFKLYSPELRATLIPIKSTDLDSLPRSAVEQGLFFGKFAGKWRQLPVKASVNEGDVIDGVLATPNDVAMMPQLRDLLPAAAGSWYYTYMVGQQFMGKNNRKAEYYLLESIRLVGRGSPYPYFHLGQLYHSLGRLDDASVYYRLAEKYDNPESRNPGFHAAVEAVEELRTKKIDVK